MDKLITGKTAEAAAAFKELPAATQDEIIEMLKRLLSVREGNPALIQSNE